MGCSVGRIYVKEDHDNKTNQIINQSIPKPILMQQCKPKQEQLNAKSEANKQSSSQSNQQSNTKPPGNKFKSSIDGLIAQNKNDPNKIYSCLGFLGEGGFSRVYKLMHDKTGTIRAGKEFSKADLISIGDHIDFPNEITIHKHLTHPHICKAFEWFEQPYTYLLITELIEGGNLINLLEKVNYLEEAEIANIMYQLMSCITYLHSNNIIHRDLKPDNIMIEFKQDETFSIKLIDFGLSRFIDEGEKIKTFIGTPPYLSPEVINRSYDFSADIWSCGVIMYILFFGDLPWGNYSNDDELYEKIKNHEINYEYLVSIGMSNYAVDLLRKMLDRDSSKRITADDSLEHPWFEEHCIDKIKKIKIKSEDIKNNIKRFFSGNNLKQACSAYLIYHFENSKKNKELKKLFEAMDKSGDGRLTKTELREGFETIMNDIQLTKNFDKIFNKLNQDGNEYIEYYEFIRATAEYDDLMTDSMIREAFNHFDIDKSGSLSIDELKRVLNIAGSTEKDLMVLKVILNQMDINCDGQISYDEFKALMLKSNNE